MATTTVDAPLRTTGQERPLYTVAAITTFAIVFAGFAPSYYLKTFTSHPDLSVLKHAHGLVMTAWFTLFLVQARLVATGRTATHRKLGALGIVIAMLVVATGTTLAIASARAGFSPAPKLPPLVFLAIPLGEMVMFAGFFIAAIALRRRSDWHKRLIVLACLGMLAPAFARILAAFGIQGGPVMFAMIDLIAIAFIAWDWRKNRRLHPAFGWGFAALIVGQGGRMALAFSPAWDSFARWLTA